MPTPDPEFVRRMAAQARAMRRVLTPELLETMRRQAEQLRAHSESFQRAFAESVAPLVDQRRLQLPKLPPRFIEEMRAAAERWKRAWEEARPPNWEGLTFEEVMNVVARVENTGYCLVWVPRAEILGEVMAGDQTETETILLSRRDDVLDDALGVLNDVTDLDLALERDAAADAISALREGHPKAAQALASSVFTSAAHIFFETGTKKIRKRMAEMHPDSAGMEELRLRTIFLAGARALDEFRPDKARPVRRQFNRHNTAHRITAEQWTEANALCAIMLSTALVRELEFWFARERESE
jgi:hypothetical protein